MGIYHSDLRYYREWGLLERHQRGENAVSYELYINPLSPLDALKHHFTSLKTKLIFLQQKVLERLFP